MKRGWEITVSPVTISVGSWRRSESFWTATESSWACSAPTLRKVRILLIKTSLRIIAQTFILFFTDYRGLNKACLQRDQVALRNNIIVFLPNELPRVVESDKVIIGNRIKVTGIAGHKVKIRDVFKHIEGKSELPGSIVKMPQPGGRCLVNRINYQDSLRTVGCVIKSHQHIGLFSKRFTVGAIVTGNLQDDEGK
jgi:hypothetical protein